VAYIKSGMFLENLNTTPEPQNSMFVIFFGISEIGPKWLHFIVCAKFFTFLL